MNLIEHAKNELDRIYPKKKLKGKNNEMNKWMYDNIIELIKTFSKQGHSGSSAEYVISAFNTLAKYKNLSKITSNKNEWMEVDKNLYQCKRCSSLFTNDFIYYYNINEKDIPKWKRFFVKNKNGLPLHKFEV